MNHFGVLSQVQSYKIEGQSSLFSQLQQILKSKSVEGIKNDIKTGHIARQYFSLIAPLQLLFSQLSIEEISKISYGFQSLSQLDLTILAQVCHPFCHIF